MNFTYFDLVCLCSHNFHTPYDFLSESCFLFVAIESLLYIHLVLKTYCSYVHCLKQKFWIHKHSLAFLFETGIYLLVFLLFQRSLFVRIGSWHNFSILDVSLRAFSLAFSAYGSHFSFYAFKNKLF